MKIRILLSILFLGTLISANAQQNVGPNCGNITKVKLGRGLVAVHESKDVVSVSWRLLGSDTKDIAFDLYRATKGDEAVKLNKMPIINSTYFNDKNADTSVDQIYTLCLSGDKKPLATYELTVARASVPYISIPLKPIAGDGDHKYSPSNASICDLDGDGEMEIVLKRTCDGCCPQYIEAYNLDGQLLWQKDIAANLPQGAAQKQPFLVGDVDGDVKAEKPEIACHDYTPLCALKRGGVSADIDPRYAGCEIWSAESGGLRSAKGELISEKTPPANMTIWWDSDLGRELLNDLRIDKWNGFGVTNLFNGKSLGIASNGTKLTPCLVADIFGDWREEVIWRSAQNDEIRIYMTPICTEYRMPSLLEDSIYRQSLALQNVGCNQSAAPGFYIGTDSDPIMEQRFNDLNRNFKSNIKLVSPKDWFLDGELAKVKFNKNDITFLAGQTPDSDPDHTVLWTNREFEGDIKIEYKFKRLDSLDRFVNIIYIQAQGSGKPGFDKDITLWNDKRKIPAMNIYFNNMNTLHISYAAYENDPIKKNPDYLRARRYMPDMKQGLKGTALETEYLSPMLFEPNVEYLITIIKRGENLMMRVTDLRDNKNRYFAFSTAGFPPIEKGRIGLRQMAARNSQYSDFTVSESE